MAKIQQIIHQCRQLAIVLLTAVVILVSLPANSAHAEGYYTWKHWQVSAPYYINKHKAASHKVAKSTPRSASQNRIISSSVKTSAKNTVHKGKDYIQARNQPDAQILSRDVSGLSSQN